jgi:hypothetical protein
MLTELLCFWCTCIVLNNTILGCHNCSDGTQKEYVIAAKKGSAAKGELFTAECSTKAHGFEIDWSKKNGFWLGRKK